MNIETTLRPRFECILKHVWRNLIPILVCSLQHPIHCDILPLQQLRFKISICEKIHWRQVGWTGQPFFWREIFYTILVEPLLQSLGTSTSIIDLEICSMNSSVLTVAFAGTSWSLVCPLQQKPAANICCSRKLGGLLAGRTSARRCLGSSDSWKKIFSRSCGAMVTWLHPASGYTRTARSWWD
jgi:hypothetical protein